MPLPSKCCDLRHEPPPLTHHHPAPPADSPILTFGGGAKSLKLEPFQIWGLPFVLVPALEYGSQHPPYPLRERERDLLSSALMTLCTSGSLAGLTDALSSLHCFPEAHSSATGKECPASQSVSRGRAGQGGAWGVRGCWGRNLRPGMHAHLGGASA